MVQAARLTTERTISTTAASSTAGCTSGAIQERPTRGGNTITSVHRNDLKCCDVTLARGRSFTITS
jgi:hypothetical protein